MLSYMNSESIFIMRFYVIRLLLAFTIDIESKDGNTNNNDAFPAPLYNRLSQAIFRQPK